MSSSRATCASARKSRCGIENHLLAKVPREKIRRLYSHPQVFGQCRQWLRVNFPKAELVEVSSTARAGELAAAADDAGALAGRMVAELHGLAIVEANVQDQAEQRDALSGDRSARLPSDRPRSHFTDGRHARRSGVALPRPGAFRRHGLNLTKIESRPSKRKQWDYVFFIDVDGHHEDAPMKAALAELAERSIAVKILGSYPNNA